MFGIRYTSSCAIAQREKARAGATPPDLFLQLPRLVGPVPLRFSALRALSKTKIRVALQREHRPPGQFVHYRRKNRRDGHQDDQSKCDAEDSVDQRVHDDADAWC